MNFIYFSLLCEALQTQLIYFSLFLFSVPCLFIYFSWKNILSVNVRQFSLHYYICLLTCYRYRCRKFSSFFPQWLKLWCYASNKTINTLLKICRFIGLVVNFTRRKRVFRALINTLHESVFAYNFAYDARIKFFWTLREICVLGLHDRKPISYIELD